MSDFIANGWNKLIDLVYKQLGLFSFSSSKSLKTNNISQLVFINVSPRVAVVKECVYCCIDDISNQFALYFYSAINQI